MFLFENMGEGFHWENFKNKKRPPTTAERYPSYIQAMNKHKTEYAKALKRDEERQLKVKQSNCSHNAMIKDVCWLCGFKTAPSAKP